MGNKLTLELTKEEEALNTVIKSYIDQATNYKDLYKPNKDVPLPKKITIESLASDNIEYSKINMISKELGKLLLKKKKLANEK